MFTHDFKELIIKEYDNFITNTRMLNNSPNRIWAKSHPAYSFAKKLVDDNQEYFDIVYNGFKNKRKHLDQIGVSEADIRKEIASVDDL